MGIFDLLRKKESSVEYNEVRYHPDDISSLQDSSKSVLNKNRYDITRFSKHETKIIEMVLLAAERKYKGNYKAIGLANESYPIMYKPRYIVFEVLIQRYFLSEKTLDKIAVAVAYWSKGAKYFPDAVKLFEEAKPFVDWKEVNRFSSLSGVLCLFSDVYEKIHEYDKAIECAKLSVKYENMNKDYLKTKIASLEEKQENWKPYRPRKMSEEQAEFERLVSEAAKRFV